MAHNFYDQFDDMPNGFITKNTSEYDNERMLLDIITTEAYNKKGVESDFYIVSTDLQYDPIWGEDNDRRYVRKFKFFTYYTLPTEEKLWSNFGIEGLDNFSMFVTKRHFDAASKKELNFGQDSFESYIPHIGDIIMTKYNKYIYEIVEVKEETSWLQSKQHIWEFIVKPYTDEHINTDAIDNLDSEDVVSENTNIEDRLDITEPVNDERDGHLYERESENDAPNDPFGDWDL